MSDDEEGERRVFHVALTRAKRQVVILADASAPSIFVAELDGSRTKVGAPAPAASSRPAPRSRGGRGAARPREAVFAQVHLHEVAAVIGLDIEYRGTTGTISAITDADVVVATGSVTTRVALGADVRVGGHTRTLVAADTHTSADTQEQSEGETRLRAWRSSVAAREAVPAYVILKDAELIAIAERRPESLAELSACRGMGPVRLERWGDEILAALDAGEDG